MKRWRHKAKLWIFTALKCYTILEHLYSLLILSFIDFVEVNKFLELIHSLL